MAQAWEVTRHKTELEKDQDEREEGRLLFWRGLFFGFMLTLGMAIVVAWVVAR